MAVTITVQLTEITCYLCGCVFGVPDHFRQTRQNDHNEFYCPNGHVQHYMRESDRDRVLRLEGQVKDLQASRDAIAQQRDAAKRDLARVKIQSRNRARRTSAGVCPYCHRTVAAMARHIHTKHAAEAEVDRGR